MGGEDLFRLREYEHRFAPRLLLRAFDSVLEARGLRCRARAAFSTLASRNLAWWSSQRFALSFQGEIGGPLRAVDFSEVVLARTRQEVLPEHFESDVTERGSFHTSPTY